MCHMLVFYKKCVKMEKDFNEFRVIPENDMPFREGMYEADPIGVFCTGSGAE